MSAPAPAIPRACDVTFFVACYNEQDNIVAALDTVVDVCRQVGCTFDIVIVDDASRDASVAHIEGYMRAHPELPIRLLVNRRNQGLGSNFAEAAHHGGGTYYRVICGDNEERKESLLAAIRRLGQADIVLTYFEDATARSWARRGISSTYNTLVNLISGHRIHYYNGLAIHLRDNVMRWHSNAHGFGFQADLITRLLDMGATCIEVPVIASQRPTGATKAFTMRNICSVGHTLLEIFIRRVAKLLYPREVSRLQDPPVIIDSPGFGPGSQLPNG